MELVFGFHPRCKAHGGATWHINAAIIGGCGAAHRVDGVAELHSQNVVLREQLLQHEVRLGELVIQVARAALQGPLLGLQLPKLFAALLAQPPSGLAVRDAPARHGHQLQVVVGLVLGVVHSHQSHRSSLEAKACLVTTEWHSPVVTRTQAITIPVVWL